MRPLRTLLFAPGNRERFLAKVGKAGADAVILDLEDAVPLKEKEATRRALPEAVGRIAGEDGAAVFVRVNPLADVTGFSAACGAEDIGALVRPPLAGIVLPKVEGPEQVLVADRLLREGEGKRGMAPEGVALIALVENARGVERADAIAAAGVGGRPFLLAFGAGDYTNDLGIEWPRDEFSLDYPRARVAAASRAGGRGRPVDTVWVRLEDEEGLIASAERARALGMFGKLCIHPKQVGPVNEVFTPTEGEAARAREVAAAFEAAAARGEASVTVDGRMVDYPIVDAARKTLALVEAVGTKG
ncbi:MAG: CoA ester lyase [bacterium]